MQWNSLFTAFEFPFFITCKQVDAYGLCGIVHVMLHGSYMEVVKKEKSDGGYVYLPRLPFKRYFPFVMYAIITFVYHSYFFIRGSLCETCIFLVSWILELIWKI